MMNNKCIKILIETYVKGLNNLEITKSILHQDIRTWVKGDLGILVW